MEKLLTEVCKIQYGFPFDSSKFSNSGGLPVIRIRDVVRGYSETYTTEDYNAEYIVNDGDMLVGMDGEFNIGKWNGGTALLNQRVCRLFPTEEVVADYLFYFMPKKLKEIEDATPFATVKHLSAKQINKITIPVPSIKKQEKIASVFRLLDFLIEQKKIQLHKFDQLVKSRFIELFGDPVNNSKGLPELTLPELGEFGRGVSKHRPRNDPQLLGGQYPLIQTGEVANSNLYITEYESTYSELGFKQSKLWQKGTLCITIAANIAKTAILTFDACFPDSVVGFKANDKTNNIFIHYWFSFFQAILEAQAPESAQKNINLKTLSELRIIVPSIDLQNEFATFVEHIDKLKFEVKEALKKLETLKKALMQEYFGR